MEITNKKFLKSLSLKYFRLQIMWLLQCQLLNNVHVTPISDWRRIVINLKIPLHNI